MTRDEASSLNWACVNPALVFGLSSNYDLDGCVFFNLLLALGLGK